MYANTFAVPISCQSLISNCDIGIASSSKQNDDHCPPYQWVVCEECDDEKAPVGIVGPQLNPNPPPTPN